ncbi:MAG: DnaB-like helicase C-terminal domain-containing protein [Burkholderiales bacterium]|nr:DnaB-like helicase C-terminal domain-containing protein [Burkholderiales bacterium]
MEQVKVFYSYSHKDETLRDELETHLAILRRQGLIFEWHDRKIKAGTEWEQEIDSNLQDADVIILLISPDFIASEYCYSKELNRALERHELRQAAVIPIIVRPTDWKSTPFSKLQALPKDGAPVTSWSNRDEAWLDVAQSIRLKLEDIRAAAKHRQAPRKGLLSMQDLLTSEVERIDTRFWAEGECGGLPTGLVDLDSMIDGLYPGDLLVIGSLPSMGKTELVLDMAVHLATKQGLPVAIFSMRWASAEVTRYLAASIGNLRLHDLIRGKLADDDWAKLTYAVGALNDAPIFVNDEARLSVTDIVELVGDVKKKYGALSLVVIDSLQNLGAATEDALGNSQAARVVHSLKSFSREAGVPVVVTSQVSREPELRPNKRPVARDLGEWQCLEEDADVIAFLYRDDFYNPESLDRGTAELIVERNRRGPVGTVRLYCIPEYGGFATVGGQVKGSPLSEHSDTFELSPEIVAKIIELAERCYIDSSGDKTRTKVEDEAFLDELFRPSPAYEALLAAIKQLTQTDIIQLQALMWLGRGAGGETAEDWSALLDNSGLQLEERTPEYIAEKAPLAKYLRNGLAKLAQKMK